MNIHYFCVYLCVLYLSIVHARHVHDDPNHVVTDDYEMWCVGQCSTPSTQTCQGGPGMVMMGGGSDVDDGFIQQIKVSNGGDFVVVRCTGDDSYNPYIANLTSNGMSPNSVTTLLLKTSQAGNVPAVVNKVATANAVFIAGGNQWDYIANWTGTALQTELVNLLTTRGCTIGGTSAGMVVLSGFVYTAEYNTIIAPEAMDNPYDQRVTMGKAFLDVEQTMPWTKTLVLGPHLVTRDRIGRLITFMARTIADGWTSQGRAVGMDEATCVYIDKSGMATTLGSGTGYFIQSSQAPSVCTSGSPLSFSNITVVRVSASNRDTFDLSSWTGSSSTVAYQLDIDRGRFLQDQTYGPDGPYPGQPSFFAMKE